jgi:asparagine synthase (glutamine-hydrolysing)
VSGLAALLAQDGAPAQAANVLAMLDAIPYRGPDGAVARHFGQSVLGYASAVTTNTDGPESQPLVSPHTGCAIVADVRLDNRAELLTHLPGLRTTTAGTPPTDAALILGAYERWGLEAPRHLLGDFAFIIWDPRSQNLVCARDGAGQRTLFYRGDRREFAAASEIHQLLQDPRLPVEPNDERIRTALLPLYINQNEIEQSATYYVGVHALEPGHVLVVGRQGLRIQRFWRLEAPTPLRYRQPEAYLQHFRELFFTAVSARLRTAGPVGVLLSGGLDSSSLVGAAQELFRLGVVANPGFATFSAVFDGCEYDERRRIESVQERWGCGFPAHYLAPNETREWQPLQPDGFRPRPELPTAGIATLFDGAQAAGTRVLLSGEVADSYLRGSPYVIDSLVRQANLTEIPRYWAALRTSSSDSLRKTLALYVLAPLLPRRLHTRVMAAAVERKLRLDAWWLVPDWMPNPLRQGLLARNRDVVLAQEARRVHANETQHMQLLFLDPPEAPSVPGGWPVEVWRPFTDRRLIEFVLAIPPEHLFSPVERDVSGYGGAKQLLRRSLGDLLPEAIRTNTVPTNFAASVSAALERNWPLLEATFGPGGQSEVAQRGYVDRPRLWERLQALRAGRRGRDFRYVNYMIGLETWLRGLRAPRPQATAVSTRARGAPATLANGDESAADAAASTRCSSGATNRHPTLVLERR